MELTLLLEHVLIQHPRSRGHGQSDTEPFKKPPHWTAGQSDEFSLGLPLFPLPCMNAALHGSGSSTAKGRYSWCLFPGTIPASVHSWQN